MMENANKIMSFLIAAIGVIFLVSGHADVATADLLAAIWIRMP